MRTLLSDANRHEYAQRYAEYLRAGGTPELVEAPQILTADQRRSAFMKQYGLAGT